MNLDDTLLEKLANWRPDGGRRTLTVPAESAGWTVALTADRSDELGCLLWEMSLYRTAPRPAQTLQAWADRVAIRVSGLLESLKVVEVDVLRNEALLRSQEPSCRGEDQFYYEALLQGTSNALIRRYRASRPDGTRREQITFALTHEALAKLAADLAADD